MTGNLIKLEINPKLLISPEQIENSALEAAAGPASAEELVSALGMAVYPSRDDGADA